MHGHGLAQAILFGGDGAGLVVCFALLAFCGLLRPLGGRTRIKLPQPARPDIPATPIVRLNAIEFGLLAELSLEQARAHEELAEDASQAPETRRSAAGAAVAWRERACGFQLQARQVGAAPICPGEHFGRVYAGPERRRQTRRREMRRTGAPASLAVDRDDRRSGPDRRQGDRRRPELASR